MARSLVITAANTMRCSKSGLEAIERSLKAEKG
jgi:hypothetical protein